jgi:hypothetical protein
MVSRPVVGLPFPLRLIPQLADIPVVSDDGDYNVIVGYQECRSRQPRKFAAVSIILGNITSPQGVKHNARKSQTTTPAVNVHQILIAEIALGGAEFRVW